MENNVLFKTRTILLEQGYITYMDLVNINHDYKEAFEIIKSLCAVNVVKESGDGRFAICANDKVLNEYFSSRKIWIEELTIEGLACAVQNLNIDAFVVITELCNSDNVTKEELEGKVSNVKDIDAALNLLVEIKLAVKSNGRYFTTRSAEDYEMLKAEYTRHLRTKLRLNLIEVCRQKAREQYGESINADEIEYLDEEQLEVLKSLGVYDAPQDEHDDEEEEFEFDVDAFLASAFGDDKTYLPDDEDDEHESLEDYIEDDNAGRHYVEVEEDGYDEDDFDFLDEEDEDDYYLDDEEDEEDEDCSDESVFDVFDEGFDGILKNKNQSDNGVDNKAVADDKVEDKKSNNDDSDDDSSRLKRLIEWRISDGEVDETTKQIFMNSIDTVVNQMAHAKKKKDDGNNN